MTAAPSSLRLTIVLDPHAEPPRGKILDERGRPRAYVGWLALIAALEELSARARSLAGGTDLPSAQSSEDDRR
jgi:hypothetical protein